MPDRKSDAPEDDSAGPESRAEAAVGSPDAPLPPAGAESVPEAVEPEAIEAAAAETVDVDAVAAISGEAPAGAESQPEAVEAEAVDRVPAEAVTVDAIAAAPAGEPVSGEAVSGEAVAEEEIHEEEPGWSFAARALAFLVVLLAGAGLGIWAAPRLAPLLPAGMAPVAAWLAPGGRQAEDEVAALQASVDQRIGGVEARVADLSRVGDVGAQIKSAVDATQAQLSGDIGALQQSVDQLGGAATVQRVARLESALEGQAAELAALKQQLSGTEAATGQLSSEAAQKIDVYRAELDGLRAEVTGLQDKIAGLGSRVDEVAADAGRQIADAQSKVTEVRTQAATALGAATAQADVAMVRSAIAGGQPFAAPLEALSAQPGVAVPPEVEAAAETGVATMAELRERYPDAAHAAIKASIQASAGTGVLERGRAFLQAQVASRSLTPQEGVGTDAVLSRIEAKLGQDDLKGALAEAAALPSEAAAAMADWLNAARAREAAVEGLAGLESAVPATN